MKFKKGIAILMASVLLLAGCKTGEETKPSESTAPSEAVTESDKPEETETETEKASKGDKDTLVVAVNANLISLDVHSTRDSLSNSIQATMVEPLFEYDDELNLVPCLAESYEISDDALTYTFKLKQGVKFHDGEDFNAEAVKLNIERVMDESKGLRASRTFNKAESINVIDEHTLEVVLSEPYMAFLSRLQAFLIVSPEALKDEKALHSNPVGTGQFIYKEWVDGDHMTMVKNPDWRNESQIQVETVIYKFVPENGTRVAQLETGEADVIWPMPNEMMEKVEGNADIVTEVKPSTICRYVTMNQLVKPFDDVRVRQALNHAIDKDAYIKVVKGGYGEPLNSAMSPVLPFYADHEPYEYDVEKAKALLTEAGYPDGFTATIWGSNDTETVKGMQFINQQLAQIGVTLEVVPMEEGTLSDSVYKTTPETTELQMWYVSWSAMDPDNAIRSTFQSEMVPPTGANTNYYNSKIVDDGIANGNKAVTFEEQYENYKIAQDQIWEDAVWMFMGVDQSILAKRANVTGLKMSANGGNIDLRTVGKE